MNRYTGSFLVWFEVDASSEEEAIELIEELEADCYGKFNGKWRFRCIDMEEEYELNPDEVLADERNDERKLHENF